MTTSAWGVEHGSEVSKKSRNSDERQGTATALGAWDPSGGFSAIQSGYHAKKGKKVRSATRSGLTTFGGGTAGGIAGGLAGAAVTRGKPAGAQWGATLGGATGGAVGSRKAWNENAARGRYKPEKKH